MSRYSVFLALCVLLAPARVARNISFEKLCANNWQRLQQGWTAFRYTVNSFKQSLPHKDTLLQPLTAAAVNDSQETVEAMDSLATAFLDAADSIRLACGPPKERVLTIPNARFEDTAAAATVVTRYWKEGVFSGQELQQNLSPPAEALQRYAQWSSSVSHPFSLR